MLVMLVMLVHEHRITWIDQVWISQRLSGFVVAPHNLGNKMVTFSNECVFLSTRWITSNGFWWYSCRSFKDLYCVCIRAFIVIKWLLSKKSNQSSFGKIAKDFPWTSEGYSSIVVRPLHDVYCQQVPIPPTESHSTLSRRWIVSSSISLPSLPS